MWWMLAAVFLIGILVGILLERWSCSKDAVGNLVIDTSDPDGAYMFLELNSKDADELIEQDLIKLKVVNSKSRK